MLYALHANYEIVQVKWALWLKHFLFQPSPQNKPNIPITNFCYALVHGRHFGDIFKLIFSMENFEFEIKWYLNMCLMVYNVIRHLWFR